MVHQRYQGENFVAVTFFRGAYSKKFGFNIDKLNDALEKDEMLYKEDYSVVKIFREINAKATNRISNAVKELNRGKRIDLGSLLDSTE